MRGPFLLRALIPVGLPLLFLASPCLACPAPAPTFTPILNRWNQDCDAFGKALAPARRHLGSGGMTQDFERGQIAFHPRWAGNPSAQMPGFVLSAQVDGDRIHVSWEKTDPYEYDFFNVRWDVDDHDEHLAKQHEPQGGLLGIGAVDPQQIEEEGDGNRGRATLPTKHTGTYIISVEGCVDAGFLGIGSDCDQGWSFPVEVDYRVITLPPALPTSGPPPPPNPPFDPLDGPILQPHQSRLILEDACVDPEDMIDRDGPHEGELKPTVALAALQAVNDPSIHCGGMKPAQLRALVNAKILESKVVSVPGTDAGGTVEAAATAAGAALGFGIGALLAGLVIAVNPNVVKVLLAALGAAAGWLASGAFIPPGDYDMRLVGLIHIAYRYDNLLDPPTRAHLVDRLLTVRGGESERRDFLWIGPMPTFIPESENHVLMTESSRYLTNELLALGYKQAKMTVPDELDNDKNGMTDWMLRHLQSFMQNDFYEYNSRPYAYESMSAVSNLYEFAGPPWTCWQSYPPDPAQPPVPRPCDVRRGARIVMDYEAARFGLASLGLRRAVPYRRQPAHRTYTRLLGRQSDGMTWRYLALGRGGDVFWKQRHGRMPPVTNGMVAALLGNYRTPAPIADLMTDKDHTWFQRSYFERDGYRGAEISYRHPAFLITAGGLHDQGRLAFLDWGDKEDAWALPTTLMPRREGLDYRQLVRIAGHEDEQDRANTCVAPGFACGLNPQVPIGIPDPCARQQDNWTFLDFNSPACGLAYGYYVVVYSEACDSDDCKSEAGDEGTFGFFEAAPYRRFDSFIADVLAANQGWDYRSDKVNRYRGVSGLTYEFQPRTSGPLEWGIVSLAKGTAKTTFERDLTKWPLVQGEILRSNDHTGCVIVENLGERLVLDFTDANRPKRMRRALAAGGEECGCPLPDSCLPPRYD